MQSQSLPLGLERLLELTELASLVPVEERRRDGRARHNHVADSVEAAIGALEQLECVAASGRLRGGCAGVPADGRGARRAAASTTRTKDEADSLTRRFDHLGDPRPGSVRAAGAVCERDARLGLDRSRRDQTRAPTKEIRAQLERRGRAWRDSVRCSRGPRACRGKPPSRCWLPWSPTAAVVRRDSGDVELITAREPAREDVMTEARINGSVGSGGDNRDRRRAGRAGPAEQRGRRRTGRRRGLRTQDRRGDHRLPEGASTQRPDGRVDTEGTDPAQAPCCGRRTVVQPSGPAGAPARAGRAGCSQPAALPPGRGYQPLGSGKGFYSYSKPDRQFAGDPLLAVLREVALRLAKAGLEYGVGDLSFEQGGAITPHKTHTSGRHADLRPLRSDGAHSRTSIGEPSYEPGIDADPRRGTAGAVSGQPDSLQRQRDRRCEALAGP